ncbi:MAG TPA: SDR family oxidoreductase [Cyclobacteriaceae bacterium]|nr:SDR family oxidoreductase [Cyclobacteriaceae bacterium]
MKQAVVTGASKGLGKAFAYLLASQGYDLLLVARSEKILSEEANTITQQYGVKITALPLDLSDSTSVPLIINWCHQQQFNPSVLINNAGYACWGYFDKIDIQQHQQMVQVNVCTLFNLTYGLLPLLRKNKQSYILNVASTTAFQAVPTMTLYAASKSFVRSFSRGLRYELRNSNVSVTCLSPGPVATNFIEQAGMQVMQETAKKFEMTPGEVASKGLKAMFNKKAESVPGFLNYLNVKLSFILPDALLEKIAGNIYLSKMK